MKAVFPFKPKQILALLLALIAVAMLSFLALNDLNLSNFLLAEEEGSA